MFYKRTRSGQRRHLPVAAGHRARYLHHGRAESLDELLTDLHSPAKVSGTRELSTEERADLIEYLRSL